MPESKRNTFRLQSDQLSFSHASLTPRDSDLRLPYQMSNSTHSSTKDMPEENALSLLASAANFLSENPPESDTRYYNTRTTKINKFK